MPLPTKKRKKSATGFDTNAPAADTLGDTTAPAAVPAAVPAADPINGSPLDVLDAAANTTPAGEPNSRRDAANAAHANGPAAGTPPPPPAPNHANKFPLTPETAPRTAAADITGASTARAAATGTVTDSTADAGDGDFGEEVSTATNG
ncbi:MAG: hypothetical protein O2892_18190 [Actinomycetota bacterium]|nr:hypothetical protein [Actinomycetota bacterium]